jgi:hypothetical protein
MSCRERREERRRERKERRRAAKELRKRQTAEGLESPPTGTIGNGTSPWKTVKEEQQARQEAVEEQIQAYRSALPTLLKRSKLWWAEGLQVLSEIPAVAISRWKCPEIEPREPKTAEIEGWILGVL